MSQSREKDKPVIADQPKVQDESVMLRIFYVLGTGALVGVLMMPIGMLTRVAQSKLIPSKVSSEQKVEDSAVKTSLRYSLAKVLPSTMGAAKFGAKKNLSMENRGPIQDYVKGITNAEEEAFAEAAAEEVAEENQSHPSKKKPSIFIDVVIPAGAVATLDAIVMNSTGNMSMANYNKLLDKTFQIPEITSFKRMFNISKAMLPVRIAKGIPSVAGLLAQKRVSDSDLLKEVPEWAKPYVIAAIVGTLVAPISVPLNNFHTLQSTTMTVEGLTASCRQILKQHGVNAFKVSWATLVLGVLENVALQFIVPKAGKAMRDHVGPAVMNIGGQLAESLGYNNFTGLVNQQKKHVRLGGEPTYAERLEKAEEALSVAQMHCNRFSLMSQFSKNPLMNQTYRSAYREYSEVLKSAAVDPTANLEEQRNAKAILYPKVRRMDSRVSERGIFGGRSLESSALGQSYQDVGNAAIDVVSGSASIVHDLAVHGPSKESDDMRERCESGMGLGF